MKRLALCLALLAACPDDEPDIAPPDDDCTAIEKRGYAGVETATGTRLWSTSLPSGEAATWRMERHADEACGGSLRIDFFDSRREGAVASFYLTIDESADGEVDGVFAGPGMTAGYLSLGGKPESHLSGDFSATVNGEVVSGVFDELVPEGHACVGESSLGELEFIAAERLLGSEGKIVQCDQAVAEEAAACVEAALAAGDGFSTAWSDAAGLHAYVGTPGQVSRYDFTPADQTLGATARTAGCTSFERAADCSAGCWTCPTGEPLDMCVEPGPDTDE
jgi:hypothetical protein